MLSLQVHILTIYWPLTSVLFGSCTCLEFSPKNVAVPRRRVVASWTAGAIFATLHVPSALAAEGDADGLTRFDFSSRDRKGNQGAVIREDYWYMMGKAPPRLLQTELRGDDPRWNAFGSCTQTDGGNSCTYVSLNQRIPAYTKYGSSIAYGASEFAKLGQVLQQISSTSSNNENLWKQAAAYVQLPEDRQLPPGPVDAELKLVLFATAMTTSPNFPQPGKELLVARFYANEVRYANRAILAAIQERNLFKAMEAWNFGQDSWNSYFLVVNRSISSKVGEKFQAISI